MFEFEAPTAASTEFLLALESLKHASIRDELIVDQIDAPANIGTNAIAFAADIRSSVVSGHNDLGTGRFVLVWEPVQQEAWRSNFRVISFAKSPLETNIGDDERIADVSRAWLNESLNFRGATFEAPAGTVTRINSSGFGSLSGQSDHAELEMRVSWSPLSNQAERHFEAWQDLVCILSGLPLLPTGVSSGKFGAR